MQKKLDYEQNGKLMILCGLGGFALGTLYLILALAGALDTSEVSGDPESSVISGVIIMLTIFWGGGVSAVLLGRWFIKRGNKFSRYVSIVNTGADTSIDNIAAAFPTTYEKAVIDLQQMLKAGYFLNGYIDYNKRELIIPKLKIVKHTYSYTSTGKPIQESKPETVNCSNCGAPNTIIPGTSCECEYCGSPLG